MNDKQQKKIARLAKIADKGEVGIVSELNDLDEKIDVVDEKADKALTIAEEALNKEAPQGEQGIQGEKGDKGDKGDPGKDGKDAPIIDPSVIAHEAHRMTMVEIIPTIPTVTQVEERLTGETIVNKINESEGKIDAERIENLPELTKEIGTKAGWGAHPLKILDDGSTVAKNARVLNFTGGSVTTSADGTINIAQGTVVTPGGSDTQVQFNDGGSFGGDAGLTYNKTTNALTAGDVLVDDEAYGSGWNGVLEVPTKNALYDKIETLLDGNGTAGYVPYYSDANTLTSESVFNYNATSNFLGVNKATPLGHVHAGADTITTATPTSFSATASFGVTGYAFGSGNKNYSVYQRIGAIFSSALTGTFTEVAASTGNFNSYTPAPNYSGSGYIATGVQIDFEAFAYFPDGTISPSGVTNSFTDNGSDPYSVTHTWSVNNGNPSGILLIRNATDYLVVSSQSSPYEDTNTGWAALPHGLSTVSSYVVNLSAGFSSSPVSNRNTWRNTTTSKYSQDDTAASSQTDNAAWTSGTPTVTPTSGPGFSGIFDGTVRIGGTSNSSLGVFEKASTPAPYQSTTDIITGLSNYGLFSSSATLSTSKLSGSVAVVNGGTGLTTFGGTGRIPFAGSAGTSLTTDASFVILDGAVANSRRLGLGVTSPAAIGHFVGTGYPPLRAGYDTSNYMNVAVTSAGAVTFDAVGASSAFTFSDNVSVSGTITTTGNIELGHATQNTLSAASGILSIESVAIPTISSTHTLTNKRITKRTGTTTSSATPTINTDNVDFYSITALATAITSMTTNLSGTPTEAQTLWIAITDNGTARAITWGSGFEASGNVALPTTTVISTRLDVGFVRNTVTSKWRCVAVS